MDKIRLVAEEANDKIAELTAKVKALEQENLAKEQQISSLTYQNQTLEEQNEKLEKSLTEAKGAADQGAQHGTEVDTLTRKLQLLEEEAEEADKNLRETTEKYAIRSIPLTSILIVRKVAPHRRQSRTLRAQGPESRIRERRVGEEVRGRQREAQGCRRRVDQDPTRVGGTLDAHRRSTLQGCGAFLLLSVVSCNYLLTSSCVPVVRRGFG